MKKSFMKSFTACLALIMVVCSLSIAGFAEEMEYDHDEAYCPDCGAAISPAATCDHVYMTTISSRYVYVNASIHRVEETILYTCAKCGHSYQAPTGSSYTAAHSYTKTYAGIDPDTKLPYYKFTCVCGHSYYSD